MSTIVTHDDNDRPHDGGPSTADHRHNRKKPTGRHGNNRKNKTPIIPKPTCGVCGLEDGSIKPDPVETTTNTTTSTTGVSLSNPTSSSVGGRTRPAIVVEVKYKCPKCLAPYCSVICYRQHKEVCPGKKETSNAANTTATGTKEDAPAGSETTQKSGNDVNDDDDEIDDDFSSSDDDESLDEGWKITDEMKNSLKNSTWLRNQLQDGGLRAMISDIVKAERKYKRHQRQHQQQNRAGGRGRGRGRGGRGGRGRGAYSRHNGSGGGLQQSGEDVLTAKRQANPNFDVFVDKVMIRAGVLERQQDDPNRVTRTNNNNNNHKNSGDDDDLNHEPIDKWLERPWVDAGSMRSNNNATAAAAYRLLDNSIERPFLTLKPIKKKRKMLPEFQRVDMSSSEDEDEDENDSDDDDDDTSNNDKSADPEGGKEKESDDGSSSSSDDDEDDEE